MLLHDGPEKTIAANNSEWYQGLTDPIEIIKESLNILNSKDYFLYYGESSFATYTLIGSADMPTLIGLK